MSIESNSSPKELYGSEDRIGKFLSDLRFKAVLPLIKGELLDIACGDNRLVRAHGAGKGVDVADYGADIVLPELNKLPLESESFDTVTIVASLNYFPKPELVLVEANRVLRPGGRLILTMSNAKLLRIWHLFREPWAHRSGYSRKQVDDLLQTARFSFAQRIPFFFCLNFVYVFTKQDSVN